MTTDYIIQPNSLGTIENPCRAAIEYTGTIDLGGIFDVMVFRGSSINKADMLGVFEDLRDTVVLELLDGKKVKTPLGIIGISIHGGFVSEDDVFDPSRHRIDIHITPGEHLRDAVIKHLQVKKQERVIPSPSPRIYTNPSLEEQETNLLTPGGMARISGYRLKFDNADMEQGIFLLPLDPNNKPDAGRLTVRIAVVGRNKGRELLFMVPADLAAGAYALEVKARFGTTKLRTGSLEQILSVA